MKNSLAADIGIEPNIPALSNRFEFVSTASHPIQDPSKLQIKFDSYRVALVPFQDEPANADLDSRYMFGETHAIVLPLTWRELVTRVQEQGNDANPPARDDVAYFGEVHVDFTAMEVRRCDSQVKLTALEFKALRYFVSNPNRVVTRDKLLEQVWGYQSYPCTRTVDNLVLKLRRKLEPEHTNPVHFRTVHGSGYKFVP